MVAANPDSLGTRLDDPYMHSPVVFCADVGSVKKMRFGWARRRAPSGDPLFGESIEDLVRAIVADLCSDELVALGFECPLFVPVRESPYKLAEARRGEGNRPWSAGAGCAVLATGLTQVLWILRDLRQRLGRKVSTYVRWDRVPEKGPALFLWEAFVSGRAKTVGGGNLHAHDALLAVDAFLQALPGLNRVNAIHEDEVHSLVGAALLRSGWTDDVRILAEPCVVVRAMPPGETLSPAGDLVES